MTWCSMRCGRRCSACSARVSCDEYVRVNLRIACSRRSVSEGSRNESFARHRFGSAMAATRRCRDSLEISQGVSHGAIVAALDLVPNIVVAADALRRGEGQVEAWNSRPACRTQRIPGRGVLPAEHPMQLVAVDRDTRHAVDSPRRLLYVVVGLARGELPIESTVPKPLDGLAGNPGTLVQTRARLSVPCEQQCLRDLPARSACAEQRSACAAGWRCERSPTIRRMCVLRFEGPLPFGPHSRCSPSEHRHGRRRRAVVLLNPRQPPAVAAASSIPTSPKNSRTS